MQNYQDGWSKKVIIVKQKLIVNIFSALVPQCPSALFANKGANMAFNIDEIKENVNVIQKREAVTPTPDPDPTPEP